MKRRFVYWLVDRLMSWIGERFEPLNYPTFYACIAERERVADVSMNHHMIRALAIQLTEKSDGPFEVRCVTYQPVKAERFVARVSTAGFEREMKNFEREMTKFEREMDDLVRKNRG